MLVFENEYHTISPWYPLVRYPMNKFRGLCLASTLLGKGVIDRHITEDTAVFTGQSDKLPVCNQNLPEAERCRLWDAVLPWQSTSLDACYQEPDIAPGGRVATVSLWKLALGPNRILGALGVSSTRVPSDQCL